MSTISDISLYRKRIQRVGGQVRNFMQPALNQRWSRWGLYVIALYILVGIFGPYLPIPDPYATQTLPSGEYAQMQQPSLEHPFGTTYFAYGVLSRTLLSTRTSLLVGLVSACMVLFVGVNIGLFAGYYGGRIESVLMGLTDLVFGLPFYPFAIIVVTILGSSIINIALVISLVFWRGIARITRSETLSLKERTFVKSSRAAGSSNLKIMYYHILPNLVPIILIYFVFGIVWGILLEASLSFVGLGDPNTISWGLMLHNAFAAGVLTNAWWWVLPPAIALWLFIWSLYVVARALEDNVDQHIGGGA